VSASIAATRRTQCAPPITTALENGAQLEGVQKAAGHRDPSATKLYDRRGYNPEKAATFFATYWD
jgi:integrase/recombinase XerD